MSIRTVIVSVLGVEVGMWASAKDALDAYVAAGTELPEGYEVQDVKRYEGAVLRQWSRVERVMSDVWDDVPYVEVWDGEKVVSGSPYGLTRDLSQYESGFTKVSATYWDVDATDEVKAKAAVWAEAEAVRAKVIGDLRAKLDGLERKLNGLTMLGRGKKVKVVRGRKVPIGTEGVVIWYGDGNYGARVGISTSDRKGSDGRALDVAWTAASNVEVVQDAEIYDTAADLFLATEALEKAKKTINRKVEVKVEPVVEEKMEPVIPVVVEMPAPLTEDNSLNGKGGLLAGWPTDKDRQLPQGTTATPSSGEMGDNNKDNVVGDKVNTLIGWPTEKEKLRLMTERVESLEETVALLLAEVEALKAGKGKKGRKAVEVAMAA